MPYYESVFIARQDISAPQVESITESVTKLIEERGGKVAKTEYWGLRSLAYRIKKNRKGHYVLLNLDAQAEAIQEMERQLRLNEDVVRYLTVKLDALEEGPSPMMQRGSSDRGRRDERGPRPGSGPRSDESGPRDRVETRNKVESKEESESGKKSESEESNVKKSSGDET